MCSVKGCTVYTDTSWTSECKIDCTMYTRSFTSDPSQHLCFPEDHFPPQCPHPHPPSSWCCSSGPPPNILHCPPLCHKSTHCACAIVKLSFDSPLVPLFIYTVFLKVKDRILQQISNNIILDKNLLYKANTCLHILLREKLMHPSPPHLG